MIFGGIVGPHLCFLGGGGGGVNFVLFGWVVVLL